MVGTGSSGIQAIPILAERAAQLTVFQRSPNFSVPAFNRPLGDEEWEQAQRDYPERRRSPGRGRRDPPTSATRATRSR